MSCFSPPGAPRLWIRTSQICTRTLKSWGRGRGVKGIPENGQRFGRVATPAVETIKINSKWLEIRKSRDFAIFSFEPYSFQQAIGSGVTCFFFVTCNWSCRAPYSTSLGGRVLKSLNGKYLFSWPSMGTRFREFGLLDPGLWAKMRQHNGFETSSSRCF